MPEQPTLPEGHPPSAAVRLPRQRQPMKPPPRKQKTATGQPPEPRKTKTDLAIEEAIARLVAEAPPLSPEIRARIAELFGTSHQHHK